MSEKARVADTLDTDPRGGDSDDDGFDNVIFEHEHITVREHRNDGTISVSVGGGTPTLVQAEDLRDALNEYIEDEDHESAAFPNEATTDTSLTVDVDADVSAARDAIESLQTDVDALTDDLNEAAMGVDFGLPAPSPDDVQAEMSETDDHAERSSVSRSTPSETNDGEMVPVEPLYELAEMWAGVRVHAPHGDESTRTYRQARKESGEWLKEELDELTGDN